MALGKLMNQKPRLHHTTVSAVFDSQLSAAASAEGGVLRPSLRAVSEVEPAFCLPLQLLLQVDFLRGVVDSRNGFTARTVP
jgi:hypothetical protein